MIPKEIYQDLYTQQHKSMQQMADVLGCSLHKVKYWADKHKIKIRTIGEAIYTWHNPQGDPFKFRLPQTLEEAKLFGLGVGLYWGEGNKANQHAIRLGNTDPELMGSFIHFLTTFFAVQKSDLRFGLQIFSDTNPEMALDFWVKKLRIDRAQFQKVVITQSGALGTYRKKSLYGVLTVHYNNKKARDKLISLLPM